MERKPKVKIALVHDWLVRLGGAERVLLELHRIFPDAPVYTLFFDRKFKDQFLPGVEIRTSALQNIPSISRFYKFFFPFMAPAVEGFDLSGFDVVVSSSVFFSKGLVVRPRTRHICYCYSPSRPLWDRNIEYESNDWPSKFSRHLLRFWDRQAAERVDRFVAISDTVRGRIQKYYGRDAIVIFPPLTLNAHLPITHYQLPTEYYLIVSRLYPHKNVDVAVDAFNKLGYNLVIVGDGPLRKKLQKTAQKNITFLGWQDDRELAEHYRNCLALIMPQEEDFGLTPVEAMSQGKPVLALRRGGAVETVTEGITGEFFDDPIPEALADGVKRLNEKLKEYDPVEIRNRVRKFSQERFRQAMLRLVYHNEIIGNYDQL